MKTRYFGIAALAVACIAGTSACNRTRELSDAQLTQLLRVERAPATDLHAPLDGAAVICLRAWSNDVELTATLPPAVTGEAAKQTCRPRIDGWLADATRNPDKIRFEEASAPPAVRRAIALLAQNRVAVMRPPAGTDQPPRALIAPTTVPGAQAPALPTVPIDLSAATAAVDELDGLCQKAKQAAANGETTQPIARYASYCDKRIEQLRARMSNIQEHGNAQQAQMITNNVQRTLEMARQVEARSTAEAPKTQ